MVFLTREQIEGRLVALHHASLELVGDLSQDTLLEHIVTLAREQAGARYAALVVVNDQGVLEQFIPVGMTPAQRKQVAYPPQGKGLLGALLSERHTIRLPDLTLDPRSVGFPANHPPMKSFLGVPILLGEQLLGLIYLTNKTDYSEFTQDDALIIETLAAYAAVAISNARLYKETLEKGQALQQRNQDLSLLNAVAVALASSLDLDEVLDHTLNRVMSYLEVESGEIFLAEGDGQELRLALHRGEAAEAFWTKDFFKKGEGTIGMVAQTGKPLVSTDLQNEMLFLRRAVVDAGFRCLTSIPLTARGNVVGVMNVATRLQRCPDVRTLELLTAIGAWAGITIENARLHGETHRLAVLEERERIGMDLHDGIVQSIYAVGLELDFARLTLDDDPKQTRLKIEQAIIGLNQTIGDIRAYIADLRPRQFIGAGIMEGLQRLVDEYNANTRSEAILIGPKNGLAVIPTSHSTALFHICQEALANVAKHSHAQKTGVHLWRSRDRLLMEVTDNGQGFDLHKMSVTLGHGLSNMHIRARKVGGDVEISSEPGEGTTVLAWVPIQGNHADHQPK